jgi:GT2 family glycosyltransferase
MAHGRKAGAKVARGKYLLQLDADMRLTPKVIDSCVKAMKRGYDACVIPETSEGKSYWASVKAFEKSLYVGDEMMSSARFFKKSVYDKLGGHDVSLVLSEDKDLHLRAKEAGCKIYHIKELLYHNEWTTLLRDLQKKFFYGRTAHVFMSKQSRHSAEQANLIFRPAYFRNWKKLLLNPHLSTGLLFLKILETISAGLGFFSVKFGLSNIDPWKN